MDIEKIRINTTLMARDKVWYKGEIITKPIPPELMADIRANAVTPEGMPTITVLERTVVAESEIEQPKKKPGRPKGK